jgi:hypothetical protein
MTRGRSRKRYQTSRNSTDKNHHSQTGQGGEIATPPARCISPRRGTDMNSSNPLQTEELEIGNDIYYAASAVSTNANHQVQRAPLFTVDHTAKPVPNAAQTWRFNNWRIQRAKNYFLNVLHTIGTETFVFFLGNWKSIAMQPIHPL